MHDILAVHGQRMVLCAANTFRDVPALTATGFYSTVSTTILEPYESIPLSPVRV